MSHEIGTEALSDADEVIEKLKTQFNLDYSAYREQIARELFDDGVYEGHSDNSTDLGDEFLKDLRVIQQDEYDQHMDEDDGDTPSWDDMLFSAGPGYIWFA